jgi:hypothetical protein
MFLSSRQSLSNRWSGAAGQYSSTGIGLSRQNDIEDGGWNFSGLHSHMAGLIERERGRYKDPDLEARWQVVADGEEVEPWKWIVYTCSTEVYPMKR